MPISSPDDGLTELLCESGEWQAVNRRVEPGEPDADTVSTGFAAKGSQNQVRRYKLAELLTANALDGQAASWRSEASLNLAWSLAQHLEVAVTREQVRLYVDERSLPPILLRALRKHDGDTAVPRSTRRKLSLRSASAPIAMRCAAAERLSERELEVLFLVEEGLSNREIAGRLFLTEGTVKWHLHNLYSKLNVRNRTAALRAAKRVGLLT